MKPERKQRLLAFVADDAGRFYYDGPLDGIWGPKSRDAERRFLRDFQGREEENTEKTQWERIRYFTREEFGCKCGGSCGRFPVEPDWELVKLLESLRETLGKPIFISSGIRCEKHNRDVGGVEKSQHLLGTAADIVVPGVAPAVVADFAERYMKGRGGIGVYDTFIHIDVRETASRWKG